MSPKLYQRLSASLIIAIIIASGVAGGLLLRPVFQDLRVFLAALPGAKSSVLVLSSSEPDPLGFGGAAAVNAAPLPRISFGDGFSGTGYIDESQTDLSLDYNVTALTFPPLYSLAATTTDLESAVASSTASCLGQGSNAICLGVRNNVLYINDKPTPWPDALSGQTVSSATIQILRSPLEAKWIIGLVTGKQSDERGWVYFYNGRDFIPLITASTTARIAPQYGRRGGQIAFGGTPDDFLIFYSGYDGQAWYDHNGTLTDVSRFFGLRVTNGGFPAQILRTTNARGSLFYVCAQSGPDAHLIKVWSLRPGQLAGSRDFSGLFPSHNITASGCRLLADNMTPAANPKVSDATPVDIYLGTKEATSSQNWIFTDRGFDNSQDRQVTSKDIWNIPQSAVVSIRLSQYEANTDGLVINASSTTETIASSSDPLVKFYFANRPDDWQEILPYNWYNFTKPTHSLYWRAVFKSEPDDPGYSPWFKSVNELLYKTENML